MFSRRSQLLGLVSMVHDVVLAALALPVAYWVRVHLLPRFFEQFHELYPFKTYWPLLPGILLIWPLAGYSMGIYRQVELRRPREIVRDLVQLTAAGVFILFACLYLVKGQYVSRVLVLGTGIISLVLTTTSRLLLLSAGGWLREKLERYRYFLIVGTGAGARELAALIEEGEGLGMRLHGFVHTGSGEPVQPEGLRGHYPVLPLEQVGDILHDQVLDEVLFAVGTEELSRLEPLMLRCEKEGIHTRIQLDFLPRTFATVYLEHLRHVPLLTFSSTPSNELELLAKRLADGGLSLVGLVALSPWLLILAILIRVTSPGPILYRQTRCGLGGRRFTVFKFRSMVENADALREQLAGHNELDGPAFKMTDDPRCTPLGHWLRKLSLDELPQLWNILRGDMSFVGPRPPLPDEVDKYESWQRRRLRMRPGLTCLWALEGRSRLNFERWMQLDLLYIDRWSLWLDLKIFLRTIPLVLLGRGAS